MRFLVPALTFLLALTASAAQYQTPFGQLQDEQKFKDYTVRIYRNENPPPDNDTNQDHQDGNGCFEILKSGKQVYFQNGFKFEVGGVHLDNNTNNLIRMGRSITSEKQPDLVVAEWSGGAHCCYTYSIFQISDTFRLIDQIEARNDDEPEFKDFSRDGNLAFVMQDWTFEYWHTSFVYSHAPTVILQYQNGKYRPDLGKMKKPAPSNQKLGEWAKMLGSEFPAAVKFQDDEKWTAPPKLWGKMLDLIYNGNMASAWKLCDLSWPSNHVGKEVFLREFIAQLQTSPYYKEISQASFQGSATKL